MNTKKLKIAQIAPLWFPVPPKKYGGTERIVSYLTEELSKRGHRVTLFASGDSKTKAKLTSVSKKSLSKNNVPWHDWWWNNFNYSAAFEKAKNFDIIHSHWVPLGMYFQRLTKTPVLHTLHNLPTKKDRRWPIFENYKKDSNVVFVSKNQKQKSGVSFKNAWTVYNGIPVKKYKFAQKPESHFIWIGRISPDKGVDIAVQIAKKARIKLLIAGQLQPKYQDYFDKKIKPQLNSRIKYVGELSQPQLSSFYGKALAFIYPIKWQEPFGLVMAEAQACGTPVIAFNNGSAAEVVKHNKTGFVVKNINAAVKAVKKIDQIKRIECRQWVEKNFTIIKMVDNYEKAYYNIIKKQ
jgi:glycosyltransferase involved in cell wall biosynthesis